MKKKSIYILIITLSILLIWREFILKTILKDTNTPAYNQLNGTIKPTVISTYNISNEILFTLIFFLAASITYLILILFKENSKTNLKDDSFQKNSIIRTLLLNLEKSSIKHRQFGIILTTTLIILIFGMTLAINLYFIPKQASEIKTIINENKNSIILLIYYLGRAIIFGSFFSGSIYFIFKLAKNSLDQSVRYRKRFDSIVFTKYISEDDNFQKLINGGKTNDILQLIDTLTKNVESAFTDKESVYKSKKSIDINEKGGKAESDDELK